MDFLLYEVSAQRGDAHYQHEGLDHWFLTTAVKMGDGFTVTFRDISEHKRLQKALEFQALHDQLTGLPNRALLVDRLAHALAALGRRGRSHAVMFVDVDRFKVINDSLGHTSGDALLVEIATRLSDAARPGDTVARFAGDEFVVLCEDLTANSDTHRISHRLLEACGAPVTIDGQDITLSVSVGVAVTEVSDTDPASLIRDAAAAMNRAKADGGRRVEFFDPQLRSAVVDRFNVELDLRRAIKRDEFRVVYQPIIDTISGRIVSVEALVRWQHPEHGLLTPDRFLPIAEETGLIVPIGEIVLQTAVEQLAEWQHTLGDHAPDTISVNLAAAQLSAPGLAELITNTLATAGLSPTNLCVEVTETALIRDPITAGITLNTLDSQGVSIALDDFGTGYSSLSYLQRFPVATVKIDRSFINNIDNSPGDAAVVAAVIALAHTLDKTIVAEGVETSDQLDILTNLHADRLQGYYFSRPVPAPDLAALLSRTVDTH